MTNELAIRILTGDVLGTTEQTQEAVTMAVRALSQPEVPDTNVGDTISRQAAIDACHNWDYGKNAYAYGYTVKERLQKLPSAQPERKKGKWIPVTNGRGGFECNKCHNYAPSYQDGVEWLSDFCPHCGANMREVALDG